MVTMGSKHFKNENDMLAWATGLLEHHGTIISVVKDVTVGDWIIFYKL